MARVTAAWAADLAGRVLVGKYRLRGLLGAGGMGAVFAAEHLALMRPVAVKLLLPGRASDEHALARFQVEARAAASVAGDGVVPVLDFDRDADLGPFQVMELLEGASLRERLRRGPLEPALAVRVVRELLATLERVHASGIVHRDLKPANIFLERRAGDHPRVRVLDFGVARVRDTGFADVQLTQPGAVLGTVGYMAPEQLTGAEVDLRSDLFAVGVVLYACVVGRAPFDEESTAGTQSAMREGAMPSLREARPGLPDALYRAYEWATALDPRDRPASSARLAAALPTMEPPAPEPDAGRPPPVASPRSTPPARSDARAPSEARSAVDRGAATLVSSEANATPAPSETPALAGSPHATRGLMGPLAVLLGCGLGAALIALGVGLGSRSGDARDETAPSAAAPGLVERAPSSAPAPPAAPAPAPLPPPTAASVAVVDPVLEAARADVARARALLAAGQLDPAFAAFDRARTSLVDPAPPDESPRWVTLGEAYIGQGDAHAARIPAVARDGSPGRCEERVLAVRLPAQRLYNTVLTDRRFAAVSQCAAARAARMNEVWTLSCPLHPLAREPALALIVQGYEAADRPGPCYAEATAGLARTRAMRRGP